MTIDVVLAELILVMIATFAAYAAWSLYGPELVDHFGPVLDRRAFGDDLACLKARRTRGRFAEITRAWVIMGFSLFTVSLIGDRTIDLTSPETRTLALGILAVPVTLTLIWCFYWSPSNLAKIYAKTYTRIANNRRYHVRYFFLPYAMWVPYIVAVYYLIGGATAYTIIRGAVNDLNLVNSFMSVQQLRQLDTAQDLIRSALELANFGRWASGASQKYLVICIIAFLVLLIEQHSYMKRTQSMGNLDVFKAGIGVLFLGSLSFGLIVLPAFYDVLVDNLIEEVKVFTTLSVSTGDLSLLLETQSFLEAHGLRWMFIETLAGYGNLLTLAFLGGIILVRRAFFKKLPIAQVVSLVLPSFLMQRFQHVSDLLGFRTDTRTGE